MKFHVGVQLPLAAGEWSPIYPRGCRVHAVYPIALEIDLDQQNYGWRATPGFGYAIHPESDRGGRKPGSLTYGFW